MLNLSSRRWTRQYFPWTLLAGVLFALAATLLGPFIGLRVGPAELDPSGSLPWPIVMIGVFLCGWLLWSLLMPNWRRVTPLAGAAAGVLAAALSYPVVLGMYQAWAFASGVSEPGMSGMQWIAWVAGLGLMTTGFAAALALAVIGAILAWLLATFVRPIDLAKGRPSGQRLSSWRLSRRMAAAGALILLIVLTGSFAVLSLTPVAVDALGARPSPTAPAQNYEEAVAAFAAIQKTEGGLALHARCPSRLLSHGRRTAVAVVFFHGLTSCPAQGEQLAQSLYEQGYNVYLPRMYGHGEADPGTVSLASLTAEHLVDLANTSTDLAQGLGEQVVVMGLSAGGTITSWTAQHRSDVALAIPISPFLGPYIVPPWANTAATNLLLLLPNVMFWINPLAPVTAPETDYVFPRPSTHTLAEVMRLGVAVMQDAVREPPTAGKIDVLLNKADVAVNNQLTEQLVALWRRHVPTVSILSLDFTNYLPHDLINPDEIFGEPDLVYSLLADMIKDRER